MAGSFEADTGNIVPTQRRLIFPSTEIVYRVLIAVYHDEQLTLCSSGSPLCSTMTRSVAKAIFLARSGRSFYAIIFGNQLEADKILSGPEWKDKITHTVI